MARTALPPDRRLRSLHQVADYLGLNERTVRQHIAAGHFPAYRLGTGPKAPIRIDLADVEAWLTGGAR